MDTMLFPSLTDKQRQVMIAQVEASFVPMPPYTLVAIADAVNDNVRISDGSAGLRRSNGC